MKWVFILVMLQLFTVSIHAKDVSCLSSQNIYIKDFCQVSYLTLAKIQAMQINQAAPLNLDIHKMEQILVQNHIRSADIPAEKWSEWSKFEKANHSFKILLERTNQEKQYLQYLQGLHLTNEVKIKSESNTNSGSTTGTRGGGIGNETYILPEGFWID